VNDSVSARDERAPVDVAVGVLIDGGGRFLLCSRPPGKVYAGFWEFPGGKLEPGETVEQALRRELLEELGIHIDTVQPWRIERVSYAHAHVQLNFCKVTAWRGELQMLEGQQMAWQQLPLSVRPVLPGTVPVLQWLAAERGFAGATHTVTRAVIATLEIMNWLDDIRWDAQGLVPVIAQEVSSNDVLMFAFMNREALARTVQIGQAVYWSRSRQRLWHKGESSGHFQRVHEIRMDCDNDVLLLKVTQLGHDPGIACHTGRHSCFFTRLDDGAWQRVEPVLIDPQTIYR
jgi:phosphoribosyl-AMP cyclohydrolase